MNNINIWKGLISMCALAVLVAPAAHYVLAQSVQPNIVGVTGPTTIPANDDALWNQKWDGGYFERSRLRWSWGDGSVSSPSDFLPNQHSYAKPGVYNARLDGLDAQGTVIDSIAFTVTVTAQREYDLSISKLKSKTYFAGSQIPVSWTTKNIPDGIFLSAWVGFSLVNQKTKKEYFLADALSVKGGKAKLSIPKPTEYSQDGPVVAGKYKLKAYMYGSNTKTYPVAYSKVFTIKSKK